MKSTSNPLEPKYRRNIHFNFVDYEFLLIMKSIAVVISLGITSQIVLADVYRWTHAADSEALAERFAPPLGYRPVALPASSFGAWLRGLPLKPGRPEVLLFNGRPKQNQGAHLAVADIDVGREDLQQCADAVMRLRAEYLRSAGRDKDICFRFTSGDPARWEEWRAGGRPFVVGNFVRWVRRAAADSSAASFRAYLTSVYRWAGSASLSRELRGGMDPRRVEPGDVFIHGGFPGHAVLVVDVAQDPRGRRKFMLAQSYMPAQEPCAA